MVDVPPPLESARDRVIAALVAERIPDGATIQAAIGAIPNAILGVPRAIVRVDQPQRSRSTCSASATPR